MLIIWWIAHWHKIKRSEFAYENCPLCGSLRISAFSAFSCNFNAEIAKIRRGPQRKRNLNPISHTRDVLRNILPAVLSTLSLTGLAAFVNVAALAGDFDATRPV